MIEMLEGFGLIVLVFAAVVLVAPIALKLAARYEDWIEKKF